MVMLFLVAIYISKDLIKRIFSQVAQFIGGIRVVMNVFQGV